MDGTNGHANSFDRSSSSLTEIMLLLKSQPRLAILKRLAVAPHSVTDLAERLALQQSSVSHCLALLRQHDLVRCETSKKKHIYRISENVPVHVNKSALHLTMRCRNGERLSVELQA